MDEIPSIDIFKTEICNIFTASNNILAADKYPKKTEEFHKV